MSLTTVLGYFFGFICLSAALYIAFGNDLIRVTIAFFLELAGVSGVLLSLNADYLALTVFGVAVVGAVVITIFSSVIMEGGLKECLLHEERRSQALKGNSKASLIFRIVGLSIGLGLGVILARAFLSVSFQGLERANPTDVNIVQLGNTMMGEQVVVFEMLAVFILIVVIGAGLLLRKPSHAN